MIEIFNSCDLDIQFAYIREDRSKLDLLHIIAYCCSEPAGEVAMERPLSKRTDN